MDRKRLGSRPAAAESEARSYRERADLRLPIDDRTELRHQFTVEIRVRNLSTHGFMAECAYPVTIGSHVSLDVPGIGPVHAQVRWQIAQRMGGMFVDPISLRQCAWTATLADPAEDSPGLHASSDAAA